jgi:hypothetical protein
MEPAVPLGTLGIATLSFIAGLVLPTYGKTIAAAVILTLGWIAAVIIFGLPLDTHIGYSLGLFIGFVLIAMVAHTLRRLVAAGWRRLRQS